MTKEPQTTLLPCPFCGKGETTIQGTGKVWLGMRYSEPISYEVRHWCEEIKGQPHRLNVTMVGKDEPSAIKAWNTRTA